MKVVMRILTKLFLLLLVIAAAGGGACAWQAYQQSTPDYIIEQYLGCLIESDAEKAYDFLDQSENAPMTREEYAGALEVQEYGLYSGYQLKKGEVRRDDSGNEYAEYHVEFVNAANEVKQETDITLKKQAEPVFGVFDSWKVQAAHCLVQNYEITVPAGAEVYLDNVQADKAWIVKKETAPAYDCYVIPTLIPGDIDITIRHAVLESVNTTLDVTDRESDYSGKMELKESARNECKETGVKALKALFSAAVSDNLSDSGDLFKECMETAEQYAADQAEIFADDSAEFKHVAVSDFAAQYGEPVFTEEHNGAITTEMTFSYRCVIREEVTYETGEYLEDGSLEYAAEMQERAEDATAKMTMAYYEGAWHIVSMVIPVVGA